MRYVAHDRDDVEAPIDPPAGRRFASTGIPDELSVAMAKADMLHEDAEEDETAWRAIEQLLRENRICEAKGVAARHVEKFDEIDRKFRDRA